MFIDLITIDVYGGRGGNGMVAFRREKYVEYGGPAGGNGGKGGSIFFVGDEGMTTLFPFRYKRHIKAAFGANGGPKNMHGKNAEDTYINVPLGTIVYDEDKQIKIGEVLEKGQVLLVAEGGKGGRGNTAFASHKNPAPHYAENGDLGYQAKIKLELKMLADVGVIGFPSVGKSTLISSVSNARPKIADYPFTTLIPNLGVVHHKDVDFVIADLPGLIEKASEGHGLGTRFLRHIERCRLFIHMLDLTRENPLDDYLIIRKELGLYDEKLLSRHEIVVVNKMDVSDHLDKFENVKLNLNQKVFLISAQTRANLNELLDEVIDQLQTLPIEKIEIKEHMRYTLKKEDEDPLVITIEDGAYHISSQSLKTLFLRTDFTQDEATKRFARQLRSLGVDDALRAQGAKHLDRVVIYGFEFEFIDE